MSFKRVLPWGLGLFALASLVLLVCWINLPLLVETGVKDRFQAKLQDLGVEFEIQDMGLYRTRLENIRWTDDLDLDLAEFHYTPQSLKAMETLHWRFKGLSLSARVHSSGVEIGGFRFP
ncbi:MAG: hypothetical protein MI747_16920, partial [Desulfobacterales bacterium]|nr:hypothetical protein [Desulfobacterales bacterium]